MDQGSVKLTPRQRRRRQIFRRAIRAVVLAVIIAGLVAADRLGLFGQAPKGDLAKYHQKTFHVTHVVDGDTLDVDAPDGAYPRTRIRLWGVDTPETVKENTPVQHFGPEAGEVTRRLTLGRLVRLELVRSVTRDKHGRLLAYVFLPDGEMLNRLLVQQGYAYADPRYEHPHMAEFARLQRKALKAGLGLWAEAGQDDLPYYYRGKLKLPTEKAPRTSFAVPPEE